MPDTYRADMDDTADLAPLIAAYAALRGRPMFEEHRPATPPIEQPPPDFRRVTLDMPGHHTAVVQRVADDPRSAYSCTCGAGVLVASFQSAIAHAQEHQRNAVFGDYLPGLGRSPEAAPRQPPPPPPKGIAMAPAGTSLNVLQTGIVRSQDDAEIVLRAAEDVASYHPPQNDQAGRYAILTEGLKQWLYVLVACAPPGPERSTAISWARTSKAWGAMAVAMEPRATTSSAEPEVSR